MFSSVGKDREPALDMPQLDAESFYAVVESRRSTRIYAEDPVSEEAIDRCVSAAQKAPNSSNLQCWELYRVTEPDKKSKLVKACLSQPAAATAPELFVFVARPDLWKRNNAWTLEEFDRRGNMPERAYQYFGKITRIAYTQGVFAWVEAHLVSIEGAAATHAERAHWLGGHAGVGAQKHGVVCGPFHAGHAGGGIRHVSDGRNGQFKGESSARFAA